MEPDRILARGPLWLWNPGKGSWHFLTIIGTAEAELRYAAMMAGGGARRGFGSIKVRATIGDTSWNTSVFPDKTSGGFILPVKAAVRKAEGLCAGDDVEVLLCV
jgi:Domain of unknown function (DUF1905)